MLIPPKAGTLRIFAEDTTGRPDQPTAGPILIQGFLQYFFQGVIITQAVKFYQRREDDGVKLRIYVLVLFGFSILQTLLESYKVWVESIAGVHWWTSDLHFTEFLCNAIICTLCEVFLIRRCFKITGRSYLVLAYLAPLSLTTVAASIILTIKIATVVGPIADTRHVDPLHASVFAYPLWVYGTLLTALSLTAILSLSLWRNKTGLTYLDTTLAHIIAITWETAALPAACMFASAILYSAREPGEHTAATEAHPSPFAEANLDLFFAILTGKVYTLGLLRTLNSRTQFRERFNSSCIGRRSLTDYQWGEGDNDAQADRNPGLEVAGEVATGEQQAVRKRRKTDCCCASDDDAHGRSKGAGDDAAADGNTRAREGSGSSGSSTLRFQTPSPDGAGHPTGWDEDHDGTDSPPGGSQDDGWDPGNALESQSFLSDLRPVDVPRRSQSMDSFLR